jgi:cation:H+ antiporter
MAALAGEFATLALVVAGAGVVLARAADAIAEATGLGRLIVGSLLLAAATSLPELSVDIAAVRRGAFDLAAGDLLGSSLMNLLILAVVDLARRAGPPMLSREAAAHALPATLGIALTSLAGLAVLTAGQLPAAAILGVGGWAWAIVAAYVLGFRMVFIDQRISARTAAEAGVVPHRQGLAWAATRFAVAAAVLWAAGPRLAATADAIAEETGLGGTFVGTTLVAFTTSLPELVATVAAVRAGAYDLAIGNTFGSNAFNMVLFAPLDAAHPGPLFAALAPGHAITAFAVIVATAVAVLGQLYHVERRTPVCEPDAWLVLATVLGALGLVYRLS